MSLLRLRRTRTSLASYTTCFTMYRVFVVVCLSVCLFVCLLATLRKNFRTDLHEIFRVGWQLANEQMIKFWWRSGSGIRIRIWIRIRIRIRVATLVRRALAEVCTVPVLVVETLFAVLA